MKLKMKRNRSLFTIIILSLTIIIMIGYMFLVQLNYRQIKAEFNGQRIIVALTQENPSNDVDEHQQEALVSIVLENIIYDPQMKQEIAMGLDFTKLDSTNSITKLGSSDSALSNLADNQIIYSYNGSYIIDDPESFLTELKEKNIIYLCGEPDKKTMLDQLAKKMSFHILTNDVILDEVISIEAINEKLFELEKIAQQNGYAIAMCSSNPLTVELLTKWTADLEAKGIKLVPITDLYQEMQ